MDDILILLSNACALLALSYIALKLRHLPVMENHERLLIPLLTGLAVIWMILQPDPAGQIAFDFCLAPIVMAGLRFGWLAGILSTVIPSLYYLYIEEPNVTFTILQSLMLPAIVSSIFHRRDYRLAYVKIRLSDGVKISGLLFLLRLVNTFLIGDNQQHPVHWVLENLSLFITSAAAITMLIVMFNEETRGWLLQRQLEMEANLDGLTRLPNFRSFDKIVRKTLQRKRISILMIDIDNFKNYNDCLGHLEGDNLLRQVGELLRHSIGEQDYLARYGGEEFVVMCNTIDERKLSSLADRLRNIIATYPFTGREVQPNECVSISIGISTAVKPNDDLQRIIAEADEALYDSKKDGKNKYSFFHPSPSIYLNANNT
jgi:diguanylate cyclase